MMRLALLPMMFLIGFAGCGGGAEKLDTAPAAGTVLVNGSPAANLTVIFHPVEPGPVSTATTDSEGKFTLRTNSQDGIVPGQYRVSVTAPQGDVPMPGTPEAENYKPPADQVPKDYTDPKTSNIKVDIPSGGNEDIKIELKK